MNLEQDISPFPGARALANKVLIVWGGKPLRPADLHREPGGPFWVLNPSLEFSNLAALLARRLLMLESLHQDRMLEVNIQVFQTVLFHS